MFGWLKGHFTNAGRLEKAARNAKAAANRYGTPNSRSSAKQAALDLEATADTTKAAVNMAEKNLSDIQKKCASDITTARNQAREARAQHDKVKDTTFQQIKRFATLGRASWGLSRSAAENLRQKQMANAAEKKREELRAIAAKQKAAMEAEEAAFRRKKELIESALGTAKAAANTAKEGVLKNVGNFKPPVSNAGAAKLEAFLENAPKNNTKKNNAKKNNNNTSRPGTPTQGGGRSRRHRRR
jgi:hypothetical protein